ncbi:MAG: hypothetical protein GY679_04365 [Mycoplasma sp.]|nr:hypothetical protein [Mycoplasma sp.]
MIKGLIDWQNEADGIIFDYDADWTLVNTLLDITVTIPAGRLRETDNSAVLSISGISGTVSENGGIVLTKVSPSAYNYSFVNDLTTVEDGTDDVYIIAKNLNGVLYTRNSSLDRAMSPTGQISTPSSTTDGKVTLFEGTTGKILKESRIGEAEITRSNRALMRGFANGIFHEFEFEIIEDSGTIYAEVWPALASWLIGTTYTKYNAIHYDGYKYTAIKDSTGVQPDTDYTTDPENTTASWYQDEDWSGDLHGTLDGTDRVYSLDTTTGSGVDGHARVALTAGTATEPQLNLVYCIPVGDTRALALTSSLTLPLGGVVFIGYAGIWDAASHSGGRAAFPQQRFTNAFYKESIEKSLIGAMREVIRRRGITHATGTAGSCVITTNAGLDGLAVENTEGLVYQLWPHLFPSNASALNLYQFNSYDVGGNKLAILTDLNEITEAADGTSLRTNNARYALEIFGIINSGTGVIDAIAVNVSQSTYDNDDLCIDDSTNQSVTTVPDDYYLTAFRICRIPLKHTNQGGGTLINLLGTTEVQDRRKWALGGVGGGAGGGGIINHDDLNNIMTADIGVAHGHIDNEYPLQFPELTTTERDAIASPNNGMKIFNTTKGIYEKYEAGAWKEETSNVIANKGVDLDANKPVTGLVAGIDQFVSNDTYKHYTAVSAIEWDAGVDLVATQIITDSLSKENNRYQYDGDTLLIWQGKLSDIIIPIFNDMMTDTDPGTNNLTGNTNNPNTWTRINMSKIINNIDISNFMSELKEGLIVILLQANDPTKFVNITLNSDITIETNYVYSDDFTVDDAGVLFDAGEEILTNFDYVSTSAGGGHVIQKQVDEGVISSEIQRENLIYESRNGVSFTEDDLANLATRVAIKTKGLMDFDAAGMAAGQAVTVDSTGLEFDLTDTAPYDGILPPSPLVISSIVNVTQTLIGLSWEHGYKVCGYIDNNSAEEITGFVITDGTNNLFTPLNFTENEKNKYFELDMAYFDVDNDIPLYYYVTTGNSSNVLVSITSMKIG